MGFRLPPSENGRHARTISLENERSGDPAGLDPTWKPRPDRCCTSGLCPISRPEVTQQLGVSFDVSRLCDTACRNLVSRARGNLGGLFSNGTPALGKPRGLVTRGFEFEVPGDMRTRSTTGNRSLT